MDTFSVRNLQRGSKDLIHNAEKGRLSLITQKGQAVILAVPFNGTLLEPELAFALAVAFYKRGALTLKKAAKLGNFSLEVFTEKLTILGIL